MTTPLATAARVMAELRERLKADFGLEDGEEALEDTLEGASDLPEMLAGMVRKAKRAEAYAEAMKAVIRDNQERKSRFEKQSETIRGQVAWAMEEAGLKKLPLADLTVTLSAGRPPVVIPNDAEVPDTLCQFKREVSKTAVRLYLGTSGPQPWAYLGNAQPTLTIRSR